MGFVLKAYIGMNLDVSLSIAVLLWNGWLVRGMNGVFISPINEKESKRMARGV